MKTSSAVEEFRSEVDTIYGVYLDSTRGFYFLRKDIDRSQKDSLKQISGTTPETLDQAQMIYGVGNPSSPDSYMLHACTQKQFKRRNEEGGQNYKTIANMCIVEIYSLWEDHYREKIGAELNIKKSEVTSDIMGDIRHYRNSIIHHQGIAIREIQTCKLLKWHTVNDEISLDQEQTKHIIFQVKKYLDSVSLQQTNHKHQ
jgi:hypothetical protein